MVVYDATRDVTDKDIARRKYEDLRSAQTEWNAKRVKQTVKLSPFTWFYKFIVGEE